MRPVIFTLFTVGLLLAMTDSPYMPWPNLIGAALMTPIFTIIKHYQ